MTSQGSAQSLKVAHITTIDVSLHMLLLNQLLSIEEQGYEVSGISSPGTHVPVIEAAGIQHIAVPMTRSFTPFADMVSFWRLFTTLRRSDFTIVHTHTPKPGLLGQIAARLAGIPIVVNTLHGFYFHDETPSFWRRFYIMTEKIAALCSDIILSQNSEDIATAIDEGICSPSKIKLLGNGIDIEWFDREHIDFDVVDEKRRELGLDKKRPVVGFVGRLVVEKGLLELLQAAQQILLEKPETQFLFVGPLAVEKADALSTSVAEEYGLSDACTFAGRRYDMPEMYALMDVFVLPSHREGFPRSAMEASAMKVPSVVTDIRGCREAIRDRQNGLLVPLGDIEALSGAVLELLEDSELATQLGENGRRIAEESFDERDVFTRVTAEYARLLKEKGFQVPTGKDISGAAG